MEYEKHGVTELIALARDCGLRNYSRMRRAELIALLQNIPPLAPTPRTRPLPPPPQMSPSMVSLRGATWEPIDDRRPKKRSPQEMDIFVQQEMNKSRQQVKTNLNKWYDWFINHVPKAIKDGTSKAFKTFKDKIMGLYNRVTGFTANQTQWSAGTTSGEPEPFKPIEIEQAFNGAYRSHRVNGRPKMDLDTFFNRIRKGLIQLIKQELKARTSARIQTTVWVRFVREAPGGPLRDDEEGQERVELAFNSLMTSVYQGSDLDQTVDGMIANMKFQIENPVLLNSRFVFDEVLYLDVNFHQLNLMRGSSYLPLPDFIAKKKAVINPQNRDKECFKWAITAVDKWMDIDSHPERVSNLGEFADNYDWSGLEFPVLLKQIGKFEAKNDISVNVLGLEGKDVNQHVSTGWCVYIKFAYEEVKDPLKHSQKFKSKRSGNLFVDDFRRWN